MITLKRKSLIISHELLLNTSMCWYRIPSGDTGSFKASCFPTRNLGKSTATRTWKILAFFPLYSQAGHGDLKIFRFSGSKGVVSSNLPLSWWPQSSCNIWGSLRYLEVPRALSFPKHPWIRLRVWSFQVLTTSRVRRQVLSWPNILPRVPDLPVLHWAATESRNPGFQTHCQYANNVSQPVLIPKFGQKPVAGYTALVFEMYTQLFDLTHLHSQRQNLSLNLINIRIKLLILQLRSSTDSYEEYRETLPNQTKPPKINKSTLILQNFIEKL